MGVVSGRIGGDGANKKMVLSNVAKSTKKTIVRESKRINQTYALKARAAAISYRNNIFVRAASMASCRFAVGTGVSNGFTVKYSDLGILPNAPSWKLW